MAGKEGWLIGELSDRVGISAHTIRYYERLGLLEPPRRTESQYRIYGQENEERLRFIQKAKKFGLSLDEIKQLE
ncbi:transcriptional regulator (plasmid) [Chondrocystis sp. NIES-4102]|nr:transcriptional regulator [Chondrocystis sp. NIES-4102]